MTVSPISPIGVFGIGSISPVTSLFPVSASRELAAFDSSSTVVSLSGIGQLLSAVSAFQSNLAVLRPGLSNSGSGRNFGNDFGSLAAEAQNFVDTFNSLQNNLNNLRGQFGILPGEPLAGQFVQALDKQATAAFDNGSSALTALAQVGIDFQAPPIPGNGGALGIDLKALQSAFTADRAGTFSLLGRAAQALGGLASGFESQASGTAASLTQQSVSLFTAGLTGSGLQGTADLLALELLNQGGIANLGPRLAALNQFLLVSTLLG
ncbi:MAG TPA: flagellar filament capping protein FliD [Novimethylophilus sp.]|uniref:flagellar filament capping protein FliD n=1 Tax=Novimethylophilus sp. TaxID=2137426 RepID=UPI002F420FBB